MSDDEMMLLRNWMALAMRARRNDSEGVLVLSSSPAAASAAAAAGVRYVQLGGGVAPKGAGDRRDAGDGRGDGDGTPRDGGSEHSWASEAAACAEYAAQWAQREGRSLVLSSTSVAWLRDVGPWVECDSDLDASGGLQCAPLGPADAVRERDSNPRPLHLGNLNSAALDSGCSLLRRGARSNLILAARRDGDALGEARRPLRRRVCQAR